MIMTLKKRKGQWKTPTETSVQFQSFINSDATWMKIPFNAERWKTVDSMRATYVNSAMHHGLTDQLTFKAFGDCIIIMRKGKGRNISMELDSVLKDCKSSIMKVVANG